MKACHKSGQGCIRITMQKNETIREILALMPPRLAQVFRRVLHENSAIHEIHIRKNQPVVLCTPQNTFFIQNEKTVSDYSSDVLYTADEEITFIFQKLCHYSVYSYKESLNDCFVTLGSGSRVGVSAEAVVKNGEVSSVKNISSLCFRIAGQVQTDAVHALERLYPLGLPSTIIIGAPCSGKTTFLRDVCKLLSSGFHGHFYKCALIDERGEMAAMHGGKSYFDVGFNTDVLSFFPKPAGILGAVRTLSPEVIIADEIGTVQECESVLQGLNSGVKFFVSLHAASVVQARKKKQFSLLAQSGDFGAVITLGTGNKLGKIMEFEAL